MTTETIVRHGVKTGFWRFTNWKMRSKVLALVLVVAFLSATSLMTFGYLSIRNSSEIDAAAQTFLTGGLIVAGVAALLLAGVGLLFARSITEPLRMIAHGARLLATGDAKLAGLDSLDFDYAQTLKISARGDELGDIGRSLGNLEDYVKAKVKAAEQIAHGNLAIEVPVASEADTLGNAMVTM